MSVSHRNATTSTDLARFYAVHLPTVYGYLHRLTGGDTALAEDLTQDTWIRLAEALRAGRQECADIRWLLAVARTRFIDHHRRSIRGEWKVRLATATVDEEAPEPTGHDVVDALESLTPLHRLVLVMRYVEELAVPDIAAVIGRSVTATNSLLARARTEVRDQRRSAR